MIIKSHIRGGYRAAADYLKAQGQNETIRTVEISDPAAKTLDEAFQAMWAIAANGKAKKPIHHISINPFKDERLTDEQVQKIVARCEQKYGYKPNDHQRVIVEHIKDGRQHFHVMWNRVSLTTGKVVKSGEHWKKSKQAAREMERELGLKRPTPRRIKRKMAGTTPRITIKTASNTSIRQLFGAIQPLLLQPHRPTRAKLSTTPITAKDLSPPLPPSGSSLVNMPEEQRIDFLAACDGKITWRQYYRKWGKGKDGGWALG